MGSRATGRGALAVIATAAVAAGGCGGGSSGGAAAVVPETAVPPDARAVELRGELASLFDEHVFLVAQGVRSGARAGFDSELYAAAEEGLAKTRSDIVAALAPLFEDAGSEKKVASRLARLDKLLLGYGREQVDADAAATPFRAEIAQVREALTGLLAEAGDELSAHDLDSHLELALAELLLALDRLGLAEEEGELVHTAAAAHRIRGLAAVLAAAVAAEDPAVGEGVTSEAARLYADLRTLLEEDLHLSFAAVQVGLAEGFDSEPFASSSVEVDESATHFADRLATIPDVGGSTVSISVVAGEEDPEAAEGGRTNDRVPLKRAVRDGLRRHWQLLELYAREAEGDVENLTSTEIEERLAAATETLAAVLGETTGVEKDSLLEPLDKADKAIEKAIDALAVDDPAAYEHLADAVKYARDAADVLNDGVIGIQEEEQ